MEIVKARIEQLDVISPLFDAYRVFYGQESNLSVAREFIESRLNNNESVIFLALDDEGNGLGFTQLYPSFSSVSAARTWVLNDLFVSDTARRQGVAKKLMDAAKDMGLEDKVKGLALETAESNKNAQKLYESLGYERESGTYHYFLQLQANHTV
ncbi:GNAT family N-acetyltransferase [Vibrio europaeus]|uniref:Acetyltransferase n=1 Tax=Vibrio europaeus TaxID=300876 RepID=A0A178JDD5_9VIBR|nr:GNAT family N-acetyltransferase [Vibrio europaeus]MDC5707656.1 GNAT family N-acetyltransferase [Vibrio europaeus]MDC5709902.1 GNAT family N-acetyltransferase [Vibrio europaeus]MDC5716621.1 GNAT family N-acetyltransferase [Vibrio europaeus]MDC5722760.1 GNAT family N-acetyltransferase [Vibrio europaeus]MDC5726941.1 GNAT family N-acetyltransferase [Vibrio europaeus]